MMNDIIVTIVRVSAIIISYMVSSPFYYTALDIWSDMITTGGNVNAITWLSWSYPVAFWFLPSLAVLGVLASTLWLYRRAQMRHYASGEVYVG